MSSWFWGKQKTQCRWRERKWRNSRSKSTNYSRRMNNYRLISLSWSIYKRWKDRRRSTQSQRTWWSSISVIVTALKSRWRVNFCRWELSSASLRLKSPHSKKSCECYRSHSNQFQCKMSCSKHHWRSARTSMIVRRARSASWSTYCSRQLQT